MENDEIKGQKNELRVKLRKMKALLSDGDKLIKSERVFAEVKDLEQFRNAQTVMMYWSLPDEVQTHNAVLEFSRFKKIILPVVKGDILELREFRDVSGLSSDNALGIGEPAGDAFTDQGSIDLVIVPGMAFDRYNNRLGRGKAYYDKLLKNLNAYKIGVCFDFQLFDNIPADEFDIKMDKVVWA